MADAGHAGDGGVHAGGERSPQHLRHAAHGKHHGSQIQAHMIDRQDTSCLRAGKSKILFQQKEQQEKDHTQHKVMGVHHAQRGFPGKAMELGKFPIKYAAEHCRDRVEQSRIQISFHMDLALPFLSFHRVCVGGVMQRRPDEVSAEQQSGQQQGCPQAGIKDCNESLRGQSACPQADAAGHHHRHDSKGFSVKEVQKKLPLLPIGVDPGRVLFHQLSKDELLKHRKSQSREQEIHRRQVGRICERPDAEDIKACRTPDQTGQKQQRIPVYFRTISPPVLFSCSAVLHGLVADQNSPDVGACLGDHQHADHGDGVRPEDHGDVESKAEHDGQPHIAERGVLRLPGTFVEQNDDEKAQKREGDIPVNAPGQRCVGTQPCILGEEAERDPESGQEVHGGGDLIPASDLIPDPPHIVENDIKDRHGDGGDELAHAQGDGEVLKSGGAEGQRPGNQVKGVAGAQDDGHNAEQPVLFVSLAFHDHGDTGGDDGDQIDGVKQGLNNGLHRNSSLSCSV